MSQNNYFYIVESYFEYIWSQERRSLGFFLVILGIMVVLLLPRTHMVAGNIFFEYSDTVRNVDLAQAFYWYAANPLIGDPAPYAHYQLSRTYFIQGALGDARIEAERELELYPDHVRTNYILGLTYGYQFKEQEAIEAFSRFIDAEPNSWAARNDKAWLQFRTGDTEGALETMRPIADVLNPWVQNTYGVLLLNEGMYEEAEVALLEADRLVAELSPETWGNAYPGNDARIYPLGLDAMRESIANNLSLIEQLRMESTSSSSPVSAIELP